MENMKKSPNRLSIELHEELHKSIKIYAAMRNITIRKWVYQALIQALASEEKYNAAK